PAVEYRYRIFVGADRQQSREISGVLLEKVKDRGYPALAEPHPRPYALRFQLLTASVSGLLEQRDAGLSDELLPAEKRRVCAQGDLHTGNRLRGIPVAGKVIRALLEVDLSRGARGLRHDRVRHHCQPFHTVDDDLEVFSACGKDLLIKHRVARILADIVQGDVGRHQSWQNANDHQLRADRLRPWVCVVQRLSHRLLEVGESEIDQPTRRDIDLDVESDEPGLGGAPANTV